MSPFSKAGKGCSGFQPPPLLLAAPAMATMAALVREGDVKALDDDAMVDFTPATAAAAAAAAAVEGDTTALLLLLLLELPCFD